MKIILTGGGSGGHFTPILAVARELRRIADEEKIISLSLLYLADQPFDAEALRLEDIEFIKISSGKVRRYVSLWNITDLGKTIVFLCQLAKFCQRLQLLMESAS